MQRTSASSGQRGISLVELMVGMAIVLILLAGTTSALLRIVAAGNEAIQSARLNHHLRTTLDRMAKDLQRAGYVNGQRLWRGGTAVSAEADGAVAKENARTYFDAVVPGIERFGSVALFSTSSQGSGAAPCDTDCSCVLFSYDLNEDGEQGVAVIAGEGQNTVNRELFGYRLANGEVQMRWAGGTGVNSCGDGQWLAVSERDLVEITALRFALSQSPPPPRNCGADEGGCIVRRSLSIQLSGRLARDHRVSMTLNTHVKIHNDYLEVMP